MPNGFKGWTPKQREYIRNANKRWNFKGGATQSGKTFLDRTFTISDRILSTTGAGLILIIGNTQATIERNVLEPMRKDYGERLVSRIKSNNEVYLFGKKAYALGADNKARVNVFRGMTVEYAYGDEVATWNEEVFEMLKSRLSLSNSIFDGTYNPDSPKHWLYQFLQSSADIYNQNYTIYDNNHLPAEHVRNLEIEYDGTVYYKRYILGEWVRAEGLVYQSFNEDLHVIEYTDVLEKRCEEFYVSCDYGTMNPTVFLLWGRHPLLGWISLREYYYSGKLERPKTDNQLANDLELFTTCRQIVLDPSAASLATELEQRGWRVLRANNNVREGIGEVGKHLNKGLILFTNLCPNTIDEFYEYSYDDSKDDDSVIKENDHCMDAVRYFVNTIAKHDVYRVNYTGRGAMR